MLVARNLLSILLLPAVVTLAVPYWILSSRPAGLAGSLTPAAFVSVHAGAAVIGFGLVLVGGTILEEPILEARFGAEYRQYKAHVPRWVPRRTAWTPPWAAEDSQKPPLNARRYASPTAPPSTEASNPRRD